MADEDKWITPPITVAQLIELLKQQPQDLIVMSEGCDCEGEAGGVEFNPTYPHWNCPATVTITRAIHK
jgi:hypothetical protein